MHVHLGTVSRVPANAAPVDRDRTIRDIAGSRHVRRERSPLGLLRLQTRVAPCVRGPGTACAPAASQWLEPNPHAELRRQHALRSRVRFWPWALVHPQLPDHVGLGEGIGRGAPGEETSGDGGRSRSAPRYPLLLLVTPWRGVAGAEYLVSRAMQGWHGWCDVT